MVFSVFVESEQAMAKNLIICFKFLKLRVVVGLLAINLEEVNAYYDLYLYWYSVHQKDEKKNSYMFTSDEESAA